MIKVIITQTTKLIPNKSDAVRLGLVSLSILVSINYLYVVMLHCTAKPVCLFFLTVALIDSFVYFLLFCHLM